MKMCMLSVDCDNCQSVTAFGRMMIDLTKKYVEEMFTISNGYEHDAQVSHSALCHIRSHVEYKCKNTEFYFVRPN